MKSSIEIRKTSITDLGTDAIVNAANEYLAAGGGVCGAIFGAAGHSRLQAGCDAIGHCDTGNAVITPGFNLKAKFVIHAVGPRWIDGSHGEPEKLRSAYKNALLRAVENGCSSVGFPLISSGIYGYPQEQAWHEAVSACAGFLREHPETPLKIIFAVLSDTVLENGRKSLRLIAPDLKVAEKSDWQAAEMPEKRGNFILERTFTPDQMDALRHGNIPKAQEDKWFWYMEGDTLYAHRSWTGHCIYIVEFRANGKHSVTVNRDPEQYKVTDYDADRERLNELLDWWSMPKYDHYNEWLAETLATIRKNGWFKNDGDLSGNG
jgi:O-acetyl-ADP-ribose deacetylase (regulator of RNase III)